ncbi:hypothetical protein H6P81_009631 [Aristolochia fimbriata]|uniref:Uncharacterized protein n=1 Tax=Aristolochia fimbriata TaxID=158543 RepID=A0AAV7EP41_ARIFI|nr:hypothetical protein H6P81_009631 [Aristolochia fimbriata]
MTEQTGRQPFRFRFPFWLNPAPAPIQRPQNTTTSQPPRPQSRPAAPFTNLLSTTTRQNGQAISSPPSTSGSRAQTSQSLSSARGTPQVQATTQTRRQPPQPSVRSSKTQSPHQSPHQTSRQSMPPTASPTSPSQAAAIVTRSVASQRPSPSPVSTGPSQSKSASLAQSNPEPTTKSHSETMQSPSIAKLDSESQPATVVPLEFWPASISTKSTASPEKPSISQASSHSLPQKIPNSPDKISGKSPSKLSEETNKKIHEVSLGSTLEADKKKDERKNITKLEADQLGDRKTPEDEEPKRKAEISLLISNDQHQIQFGSVPTPSTERKITRPNKVEKHREPSEDKSVMMEYEGDKSKLLTSTKQHSSHTTATDMHPHSSISNSETVNLEKEIRQDTSRYVHQATARYHRTEDDSSVNVITLTGENKGAHMNISSKARNREGLVHIHRGYKVQMEDKVDITKNVDDIAKEQPDSPRSRMLEPNATYANSNSQGINNSILYNSSCSEKNPGIHLTLSYGLLTTANQSKERKDLLKTLKENSIMKSTTPVVSQTNIRRRCLRALFMESSESDPENQHKPRRHGCRYQCGDI